MIKVSFKENPNCPTKAVATYNNKVTYVTLIGKFTMPNGMKELILSEIWKWISQHPEINWEYDDTLAVQGKATCSSEDTFDVKLGERIAESRAKIKLYRFLCTLISKIMHSTSAILYGNITLHKMYNEKSTIPCLSNDYNKYSNLLRKEQEHLNKLLTQ